MAHNTIPTHSWEFVTTLEYEWDIIRGRIPYQWTIWVRNNLLFALISCSQAGLSPGLIFSFNTRQIYSLARVAALAGIILDFILLNNTKPINCQVGVGFRALICVLIDYHLKAAISFMSVSAAHSIMCSHIPEESGSHSIVISFPALLLLVFVGLNAVDRFTRVRPRQLFQDTHNLPKSSPH